MNLDLFPYLVIGLAEWLERERRAYPYPPLFQRSLNYLSLALLRDYPQTTEGIMHLFARPVKEWWFGEYPASFMPEEPLVEDGALSYEAVTYLDWLSEQDDLSYQYSLSQIELVVDNRKFRELLDRLREKSLADPEGTQQDYVTLRRFLIEHPYVRVTEISHVFSQTNYINAAEVAALYVEANQMADVMHYPDEGGQPAFWLCGQCGPLYVRHGRLESLKPADCDYRCPRYQSGWQTVPPARQLRVLRKGIHVRTHLPGIPELQMFIWLQEQHQQYPQLLLDVALWPRIDLYDIQLQFADAVWAVDLKDHRRLHLFSRNLSNLYREGNLYWDKAFYVYPVYREKQQLDYGQAARQAAIGRLTDTEIVSEEVFKSLVRKKIHKLKKGSNHV